jgi:endoglucanase
MRRCGTAWILLAVMIAGCGSSPPASRNAPPAASPATSTAADRFLNRYVTEDGRVVRHDQGGDIVSESQAYGMLIAEVAGRPATVATIWRWTARHLRRSDGLLAYHATGTGQVEDTQSATDADVLAAYALLRYRGPDADRLNRTGRDMATAVLDVESVPVAGVPVLVAGPWAKASMPPMANPSYWMPSVFAAIGRYTGDRRWSASASEATRLLAALTGNGSRLPPEWARIVGGRLVASGAPDGSAPVEYGLNAARLPLWYAAGCTTGERNLAAAWWRQVLSHDDRSSFLALDLNGQPLDRATNPVSLLAGGAAAAAAGDERSAATLRRRAVDRSREAPTYYGDAWVALAGALSDDSLGSCSEDV